MIGFKSIWIVFLGIVYFGFSAWYGGGGDPLSPEEGAALLKRLAETYGQERLSADGNFYGNIKEMIPRDDGKEFYAVNLEQRKSGEEAQRADEAYANVVLPLLLERGAHPVFVSLRAGLMLGKYGSKVDRVAVVRYRSLKDMIEMVLEPAMQKGSVHKFRALEHTEVFITRPLITFVHVRITVALFLLVLGLVGLKVIDFVRARRASS